MATYSIGGKEQLRELVDFPQMEPGAPAPLIVANERICAVAYHRRDDHSSQPTKEPIAIVVFDGGTHYLGGPNDEALSGHPLASRGLVSYGAFEVLNSSWIRGFEQMNRVHPSHSTERFSSFRHFILTFHDSTFECMASRYEVMQFDGSMSDAIVHMKDKLVG